MAWRKGEFKGMAPETTYIPTSYEGLTHIQGHAPQRQIAQHEDHKLVTDYMERQCYDISEDGYWYLFRYTNDREAKAKWRGWLRSRGVDT